MKSCKIFLFFLLLKCKDISTNAKEVTCQKQELNNVQILMGNPGINPPYTSGHVLVFKCIDDNMMMYGQRTIECQSDGNWDNPYPQCGGSCQEQELRNVQILMGHPGISPPYTSGHVLVFKCTDDNIKMYGQRTIECQSNGNWDNPYPQCEAFCSKPLLTVNNAKLIDETQDERKYSHGDALHYECVDGYESNGEAIAKCDTRSWIYPECIKIVQCTKPTTHLQFVTLLEEKNLFNNFDTLAYKCNEPYNKNPGGTLMCKDEKWIGTIDCTSSICPPPPLIEDGDYNIVDKIDEIITEVSYSCQSYYVLNEQKRFYRCQDGRWETPPKCLKPCELTPEIYEEYNIQPLGDKYVRHSDRSFTINCKRGWRVRGSRGIYKVTMSCSDGTITIDNKCDKILDKIN